MIDSRNAEFEFGDPASDAFLFDFDVVVRQGIDLFDGGFDDRSVKFTEGYCLTIPIL